MTGRDTTSPTRHDRSTMPCIVCNGNAAEIRSIAAAETQGPLKLLFQAPLPEHIPIADYRLMRCRSCELVFAEPMLPGDARFYDWLAGFDRYHSGRRWEWDVLRSRLSAERRAPKLLELGCGNGALLRYFKPLQQLRAIGVDIGEKEVSALRAAGLEAHCGEVHRLPDIVAAAGPFDAIVMSHVLEHVADPLGAVRAMRSLLAPAGAVFVSLPYSPTSGEVLEDDVMNLPPHHLTRWNLRALRALAGAAGMSLRYATSRPKSALKRALQIATRPQPPSVAGSVAPRGLAALARAPLLFVDVLRRARRRERIDGRRAGDTILAEYRL